MAFVASVEAMELALEHMLIVFRAHDCKPLAKAIQIGKTLCDIQERYTPEGWAQFRIRFGIPFSDEFQEFYRRQDELADLTTVTEARKRLAKEKGNEV